MFADDFVGVSESGKQLQRVIVVRYLRWACHVRFHRCWHSPTIVQAAVEGGVNVLCVTERVYRCISPHIMCV